MTDAAGTLHAVWRDPTSTPVSLPLYYCRVAAGGTGCVPSQLTTDVRDAPRIFVRPQDGFLIVVFSGVDDTLGSTTKMVASGDGGTSWTPPVQRRRGPRRDRRRGAVARRRVHRHRLEPGHRRGPLPARAAGRRDRDARRVAGRQEGRAPAARDLSARRAPRGHRPLRDRPARGARARRRRRPGVQASWGAPSRGTRIAHVDAGDADIGPTGTWMLATDAQSTSAGAFPVRIWHWGSRGFERPRTIGALARGSNGSVGRRPGHQPAWRSTSTSPGACTPRGRWRSRRAAGRQCIVYRRTDRAASGRRSSTRRPGDRGHRSKRFAVAANSGGSGWLVWDDLSDRIRAVPLVTPPLGSRVGSRRIGRRRVTVPDFYGCVPSGGASCTACSVDGRRGARGSSRCASSSTPASRRAPTAGAPWRTSFTAALRAGQQARRGGDRPLPPAGLAHGANGPRSGAPS